MRKVYFLSSMNDQTILTNSNNKNDLAANELGSPSINNNQLPEKLRPNSSPSKLSYPQNIRERFIHWKFYGSGIVESTRTFFFGHPRPPDRAIHPSAHNYYLDIIYNYGFIAIIPLIGLLSYLIFSIIKFREHVFSDRKYMIYIFAIFIVFILENSLKVGLRQPYPGIFSFFILGLFQARLDRIADKTC
jgi:hypothetical protein